MAITRRTLIGGLGTIAGVGLATATRANNPQLYFNGVLEDHGFVYRRTDFKNINKQWQRQLVQYFSIEPPGTVVVDTANHYLYIVWGNSTALRYGIGVGREGLQWFGRAIIDQKVVWPRWVPSLELLLRQPDLPLLIESGDPENPLGPRALYLHHDGRDLGYRLHGTTRPWTIGTDISSGGIHMFPEDIIDLYQHCPLGTEVLVLEHLGARRG